MHHTAQRGLGVSRLISKSMLQLASEGKATARIAVHHHQLTKML